MLEQTSEQRVCSFCGKKLNPDEGEHRLGLDICENEECERKFAFEMNSAFEIFANIGNRTMGLSGGLS